MKITIQDMENRMDTLDRCLYEKIGTYQSRRSMAQELRRLRERAKRERWIYRDPEEVIEIR
jgi:hypothetical protein